MRALSTHPAAIVAIARRRRNITLRHLLASFSSALEAAAAVAMELAAALARPTQTGSRSATEAAAAAVGMEPAAALLWFFEVASSLPRTRQPLTRRRCSCEGLSAASNFASKLAHVVGVAFR